jgi:hypothetical protein
MKKSILSFITLSLLLAVGGCDDFLDTTPTGDISDKTVWTDIKVANLYSNNYYAYLDRYGLFSRAENGESQFNGNMTEGLTETFKYGSRELGSANGDANWIVFIPEQINPSSECRLDIWSNTYLRIRRVNEFLVGLRDFSTFDEQTNRLFEAQIRFFRAFLYFQLAKRHGGVILYTDMNLVKDKNRSSAEDTWILIESDLDFAAAHLPVTWDAANTGRLTKGAVFAFKSRAMLYAERWQSAKDAADSVFSGAGLAGKYALTANYADAWKGSNSESILEYRYLISGPNHRFDRDYAPFGDVMEENGGGKAAPTQEMVESYEKANGTTVDWSAWHGTTTTRPPYDQLEPRFHATVIYNGCTWKGQTMENSVGGTHGRYMEYNMESFSWGRTVTGYYLRKLLNESNTDLITDPSTQTMVEIRLAEVYLNRAEARYRLNDPAGALSDINAIRARVNLPPKTGLSGDALFAAIRQERKIELAYEGHLYWDMRRWKLAHIEYNNYRVHGLKITGTAPNYTYEYVDCDKQDRKFLAKTYVFPVPYSELQDNNAIEQYDEWK